MPVVQHAGMFVLDPDRLRVEEKLAMRALIVLSLTAIIFGSTACEAGMSTGPHKVSATAPAARTAIASAPRTAPASSRVAVSHRREGERVHYASGSSNPIAVVGGAIGNTLGAIFHR
jgi:hypothetical protein